MTILFFTRLFYPHIGGVEKHVLELSKKLIEKKQKVIVITEKHEKGLRDFETIGGIIVIRLDVGEDNWFKKFRIWQQLLFKFDFFRKADIVHCHDVFFWYLPFRFLFFKKPVYTTFHGYESFPVSQKAKLVRKLSEVLSFGNICIGNFISKWYGTRPTYISYGGVSIEKPTKASNNSSAVFIGRLDEQTGILSYVEATKFIQKKIPQFFLTVVGDGKLGEQIKKSVKVVGFEKNPRKYLINHRFAFVSRYLAILEAMAEKRLVFAVYDNEIKKDYLCMTPFKDMIVIEKDPKKLAEKVLFYINHPQKEKELIESAYSWVKEQTWESLTNTYLQLWQKK